MTFLSKGVCVPEEHVADGVAPMTPGPDGRPFDWTRVTAGNFFVASQKHRPRDAEVAVQYRGYWFYIPREDVNSRSVLAVLEILFALQESDEQGRPGAHPARRPLTGPPEEHVAHDRGPGDRDRGLRVPGSWSRIRSEECLNSTPE